MATRRRRDPVTNRRRVIRTVLQIVVSMAFLLLMITIVLPLFAGMYVDGVLREIRPP